MSAVQRADSLRAIAARPASNLSLAVYAIQNAISHSTQTVEHLEWTTRGGAAVHAVGLKNPAESRWISTKGVATPANRSSTGVSNASSTTANVAVTVKTIFARVNKIADSARRRRSTVSAVQCADSLRAIAA